MNHIPDLTSPLKVANQDQTRLYQYIRPTFHVRGSQDTHLYSPRNKSKGRGSQTSPFVLVVIYDLHRNSESILKTQPQCDQVVGFTSQAIP